MEIFNAACNRNYPFLEVYMPLSHYIGICLTNLTQMLHGPCNVSFLR